ncbi:MAG TPA: LuxR C-terminal-related transcriptional regulator [Candidatus Glassbacteria bacterium]|nr:LuxR C-terminal-related transcriptional regulator [Candidatus Glassbacteria bacterium]
MPRDRTKNRSDAYQPQLMEISVDPFVLGDLSLAQGMSYRLEFDRSEKLMDLRDELKIEVMRIIETGLTKRQEQVVKLTLNGETQNEIAKQLGINQTSVHKVIRGNIDYKNGKRRYGGAFKKLIKLCQKDEKIQDILNDIRELSEEL